SRQELHEGSADSKPRAGEAGQDHGRSPRDVCSSELRAVHGAAVTRAVSLAIVLAVCGPAAAQTPPLIIKSTGDIADPVFAPRGDKIAANVGRDRICVWSALDGTLIQTIELPDRP